MGCDLFLDEHNAGIRCDNAEHRAALARRAEGAPAWSAIERARDGGGLRDFLDGRPIHCGTGLELQAFEIRSDDYGDYQVALPNGSRVRYELGVAEGDDGRRPIVLHAQVGGHEFVAAFHPRMRFRWPERH
jgi:hypothetical protein